MKLKLVICALIGTVAAAQPAPGDVRFHWTNPTEYEDGSPLDLADVARVVVEWGACDADGAFVKLGEFNKNGPPIEPWVDVPLTSTGLLQSNCERARLVTAVEANYELFISIERVEVTQPKPPRPPTNITVEGRP